MMIERLKKKDIKEAAKVYYKGLQMETPKGRTTFDKVVKHIKEVCLFVYKEKGKIKGLVSFTFEEKDKIKMDFICALELRKGIGKKLMKKLVEFAIKHKVRFIYSNVSSQDKRVIKFYESLGFKKYGRYFANKNFILYKIKAKPEWVNLRIHTFKNIKPLKYR